MVASWGLGWGPRALLSTSVLSPRRTPCCLRVQCGDFSLTAEDRCYLRKHGDYFLRDMRKDIRTRGGFSCSCRVTMGSLGKRPLLVSGQALPRGAL